jgi:hypothetical protein
MAQRPQARLCGRSRGLGAVTRLGDREGAGLCGQAASGCFQQLPACVWSHTLALVVMDPGRLTAGRTPWSSWEPERSQCQGRWSPRSPRQLPRGPGGSSRASAESTVSRALAAQPPPTPPPRRVAFRGRPRQH